MKILKADYAGLGRGSLGGPSKVQEAIEELYCSETGFKPLLEFLDVEVNFDNVDVTMEEIERSVIPNSFILGGDHSITYGGFKGFVKANPKSGIIIFDAHVDCMDDIKVTQENYLRVLIEEGLLDSSRVVLIGVRNWHKNEIDYLKEKRILYFTMKRVFELGVKEVCDLVMEKALTWFKVYVSVDIDVVDPAFAPGTGYCEPGGFSSRELLYFLQRIKRMRNFGMFDLVEISPCKDVNGMTVSLGAKILKELG